MTTTATWATTPTDLSDTTVLVVGGAGSVGEGVTRTLLDSGATVIATARSDARLDDLRGRLDSARLVTRTLDLLSPDLDRFAQQLAQEFGLLDGVVLSTADWGEQGRKPLLDYSDAEWDALVAVNQTAVFRAYRSFVPVLTSKGMIARLGGMSAELPFPGAAVVAASAAAIKSLTRTLAAELGGQGPRVYQIILGMIRTRPRQQAGIDDPSWVSAGEVGVHVAQLVAGTSPLIQNVVQWLVDPLRGPQATPPRLPGVQ